MSLKTLFGLKDKFSYVKSIDAYGLELFAMAMTHIVEAKFNQNPLISLQQHLQFVREEADAMNRAGGYAGEFARKLFADEKAYRGSMDEEPEYPVDYPGGPQQTLLRMTLDCMGETGHGSLLPVKFRCAVVENVFLLNRMQFRMNTEPEKVDMKAALALKMKFDEGDDLLGELVKKYPEYFGRFTNQPLS